jgi:hypothetical protein
LFVGILVGSVAGAILDVFVSDTVVEKVLINSFEYELEARPFNMIICTITFGFSIKFNLFSLIAIIVIYIYYLKYYFVWR